MDKMKKLPIILIIGIVLLVPVVYPDVFYFKLPEHNYGSYTAQSGNAVPEFVQTNTIVAHETSSGLTDPDSTVPVRTYNVRTGQADSVFTDAETASALSEFMEGDASAHGVVARNGDIFIAVDQEGVPLIASRKIAHHAREAGNVNWGLEVARSESELDTPLS